MPEDGYYAHDIIDIATDMKNEFGDKYLHVSAEEAVDFFKTEGCKRELEKIKTQIQTEKLEYSRWLREEARDELVQCVNNILSARNLSCYLIEPIFAELYSQIKVSAQNELAQARAQMQSIKQTQESKEGAE